MTQTVIHQRVQAARDGTNPTVITRMPSGWAVLGDQQYPHGYALLLSDPVVPSLNDLALPNRQQFLLDMSLLGDAIQKATGAYRINYGIYGNTDQALHAHIFARYEWEPEDHKRLPVWFYPKEVRDAHPFNSEQHGEIQQAIRAALARLAHEIE